MTISCRGVTRIYRAPGGSTEALHAVAVDVPAGSIGAIVGPSGSGKSTLLRLLAGMDAPDEGVIVVGGTDLTAARGSALRSYRRDTAAFISQRAAANLVPHLTVEEQLGRPDGLALISELGLERRLHARADELSCGEQARAALAVGLSRGTSVVLVDEPTAELDRAAARCVIGLLARIAADGRTVVVATHDPDLVRVASAAVALAAPRAGGERSTARGRRSKSAPAAIVLSALTKSYDGRRVVDGASLDVPRGELGALLGRSGSGKSTLMMIAGGWLRADAGSVSIPGGDVGGPPPWRQTAYLAQRFGLLPELTVGENVALPLRLARAGSLVVVDSLLHRLALEEIVDRAPHETSIGQQQRSALARALVHEPAALLADEPTSHQDAGSAELVWHALEAACEAGTACLVATNDERLAARADRVWHIEDGRVGP